MTIGWVVEQRAKKMAMRLETAFVVQRYESVCKKCNGSGLVKCTVCDIPWERLRAGQFHYHVCQECRGNGR